MMRTKSKTFEIDMCHGPLPGKILLFTIPLMLSGILQLLFNAADVVVVGQFAGSASLAAVGSTSSLINLLINVFVGLSVGVNVLVARYYGAKSGREMEETIHTAMAISLIGGFGLAIIGIFLSGTFLAWMGTPDDVIPLATIYMKIYFAGMPLMMVYNFGAAILRAVGDTRRPLIFLLIAGVINVILNLFFVIVCKMGVAGVALATVISQVFSTGMIVRCLMMAEGDLRLRLGNIRINADKLRRIMQIGIPAGLQGVVFSISNVIIQSSVNSFGSIAMAGNTAAANIEGFVYNSMNSFHQANVSFTGQNIGARKYGRINKVLIWCQVFVILTGLIMGLAAVWKAPLLLSIYSTDTKVIEIGILRLSVICGSYFLCGVMDVMVGSLRGMGYGVMPMLVSMIGACGFRIVWIMTIFQMDHTLWNLYISYPISWGLTAAVHLICFVIVRRRLDRQAVTSE